jgi:hypothetical protein
MLKYIEEFHDLIRKSGMKAAPDKTYFFQKQVQYLGHVISEKGVSPIHSRIKAIQEMKSPQDKTQMMKVLGAMNFYSRFINGALYPMCKPFFTLIKDNTTWEWTDEHEKLLREILALFSSETIRAIPNTKYPFSIHCDASNIGIGFLRGIRTPNTESSTGGGGSAKIRGHFKICI